jgi:N-acetylglucosaminyl-diphospho-decaprenol L-rhamnosyltransferase
MPTGSVIIVSHNSGNCIEACLRALVGFVNWKIILVDNASTDATIPKARRAEPKVCLLLNTQNVGFAGAVNQGAAVAEGDILVILNPDAVATVGSLDSLCYALGPDEVGAAGGLLVHDNGTPEKGFLVRRFPTPVSMLAEVLLLNRVWPTNPWNRRYRCLDLDYTTTQEVEQPAGACLAVKREAWEEVGGFDKSFFPVWFEDVDFCRRLYSAGWKILYCSDAIFTHAGGDSVNKLRFRDRQSFWYRNLLRYFAKHHSCWDLGLLRAGIAVGLLFRALLSLVGFRPADVSVAETVGTYWHVVWNYVVWRTDL